MEHRQLPNQLFKAIPGNRRPSRAVVGAPADLRRQRTDPDHRVPRPAAGGNVLVNSASQPTRFIRPGETQRWRFLNATVSSLRAIRVQGHQTTLIGRDGNTVFQPTISNSVLLATPQCRDVLTPGGQRGTYQLAFQDMQGPGPVTPQPFASLTVTGAPVNPQPLPTTLLPFEDLPNVSLDRQRAITFNAIGSFNSKTFEGHGFVTDNQAFDPNRVDQFSTVGDVEEWTVRNLDVNAQPFHIHINPYQVTHINGQPFDTPSYEDTTIVPPSGGSITFRTRFRDFSGTFVYHCHCHILDHEDGGMMGVIQAGCSPLATLPTVPGSGPNGPGKPGPVLTGPGRPPGHRGPSSDEPISFAAVVSVAASGHNSGRSLSALADEALSSA